MTKLTVDPEQVGQRLDVVVAAGLGWTRSRAERAVEAGLVLVNGTNQPRRYSVGEGDQITVAPEPVATIIPPDLLILYQDSDLLVVDKPAGVLTHPGSHHTEGTVADFGPPAGGRR